MYCPYVYVQITFENMTKLISQEELLVEKFQKGVYLKYILSFLFLQSRSCKPSAVTI